VLNYFLLSVPISYIHQHFLSEFLHEATHWNLAKRKSLNDILALILIGVPFGVNVQANRKAHFVHHSQASFLNDKDPETSPYQISSIKELLITLLLTFSGFTALKQYFGSMRIDGGVNLQVNQDKSLAINKSSSDWLLFLLFTHLILLVGLFHFGYLSAYIIYYGTLVTIYPLFAMMRFWGQHAQVSLYDTSIAFTCNTSASRSNYGGFLEFLFFNTPIMSYHYEHHLYPELNFRILRRIARKSSDPNITGKGCISVAAKVYRGLLK